MYGKHIQGRRQMIYTNTTTPESKVKVDLYLGDCLHTLRKLPDNSVDSIVTDPPYGLSKQPDMAEVLRHWLAGDDYTQAGGGFMGKSWDSFVPGPSIWRECLRVLKPGGHLLAFFGTRTQDMGTLAIRLAGFEIRDSIAWVYGSGYPKSMDVSKAIDGKLTTGRSDSIALREVNETRPGEATVRQQSQNGHAGFVGSGDVGPSVKRNTPATDAARQWQGWGTALKPALEPITVARKPLAGTVAANVLAHGTGALNIDGCRVGTIDEWQPSTRGASDSIGTFRTGERTTEQHALGRWPANLVHDGSDVVVGLFPAKAGAAAPVTGNEQSDASTGKVTGKRARVVGAFHADKGSAARFFYCAKASKRDRDEGCSALPVTAAADMVDRDEGSDGMNSPRAGAGRTSGARNFHPTVKPTELMRWLVRLVTPPGGVVLDPFTGSGSTGKAAMLEGFRFIGCELSPDYMRIAVARIGHVMTSGKPRVVLSVGEVNK
jgi:DNA modification methylase